MNNFWPVKVLRYVSTFFVLSVIIAMVFYPGGNIHNPNQVGYSVTHNFLSDLGGYQSHSEEVNFISAFFFNMAMFLFIAVGVAFLKIHRLFSKNPVDNIIATAGSFFFVVGTIFFAGVGLTPYDLYLDTHAFFAVNAFRLMVPASLLYFVVLLRSDVDNRYALTTGLYLGCVVSYVIYLQFSGNPFDDAAEMVRQATIQKLIVMASVISVFSLSFAFQVQIDILSRATGESRLN
jgi:hypothetical membrane protein